MKYDGDANKVLASKLGVNGFPSLFFFPRGKKSINSAQPYQGGRELQGKLYSINCFING